MIRVFVLISFLLSNAVASEESNLETRFKLSMCAAANALLTTYLPEGDMRQLMSLKSKRFADASRVLGSKERDLEQALNAIVENINSKKMSMEEVGVLAKSCGV